MSDTNLVEFYNRVADYQKSHDKGFGHEAPGTLSRSVTYGNVRKRRRVRILPLVFVVFATVVLKASILHSVGEGVYQERVDRLTAGEGFDRLGGWLMQVDPVTAIVADKIALGLAALKG